MMQRATLTAKCSVLVYVPSVNDLYLTREVPDQTECTRVVVFFRYQITWIGVCWRLKNMHTT